jgi:hypothetical protein
MSETVWTVVIRKNGRGQFKKTGFEGTWKEAVDEAQRLTVDDTIEAWYVGTDEDHIITDSGRRVGIAPTAEERKAAKERKAEITRQAEDMLNSWLAEFGYLISDARALAGLEGEVITNREAAYALAEAGWTRSKLGFRHS